LQAYVVARHEPPPREKYVFLIRHAQSTWNQNVELVKTFSKGSLQALQEISVKDVVSRAAHLMAKEVWSRDHPISEEGLRQTGQLRQKIGAWSWTGAKTEREQRFYESFLSDRVHMYCSPLLRALQTAHLVFPEEDGWGTMTLLKDARELYRVVFERDCLGTGVGEHIVDRAMQMGGQELPGLMQRVDSTDCAEKWWSDEPETDAEVDARLTSLWKRIVEEGDHNSCLLVTHSNLIKALLMRFGVLGVLDQEEERRQDEQDVMDSKPGRVTEGLHEASSVVEGSFCTASSDVTLFDDDEEDCRRWQVVDGGSEALRQLKVERLQNCGVLGLRCVLEAPKLRTPLSEVMGWVDTHPEADVDTHPEADPRWVVKDALLMFDSVLVN
jgi:broad specificity phosphatase PhoE